MIQEKAKSLYDNLKQKEGEGSKTGEFNESVEWSDHFIKWFGFKNVKMAEEVASAHQEAADEFPDTIKKIIEGKEYLPEQVFNADESTLLWGKMPQKILFSKE